MSEPWDLAVVWPRVLLAQAQPCTWASGPAVPVTAHAPGLRAVVASQEELGRTIAQLIHAFQTPEAREYAPHPESSGPPSILFSWAVSLAWSGWGPWSRVVASCGHVGLSRVRGCGLWTSCLRAGDLRDSTSRGVLRLRLAQRSQPLAGLSVPCAAPRWACVKCHMVSGGPSLALEQEPSRVLLAGSAAALMPVLQSRAALWGAPHGFSFRGSELWSRSGPAELCPGEASRGTG